MLLNIRQRLSKTLSQQNHTVIILLIGLLVGSIYAVLRIAPVIHESVAYTYDQGRDFAAARDIVKDHNLVLIGPTTGMQGIFHGAWWYYYLAVAFVLFSGAPQGFYFFMILCGIVQVGLLVWFLKKNVSAWLALMTLLIISASPYFIYTSTFASNTILMFPALLVLLYGVYASFKTSSIQASLCIGLGLGFLLESEVAFGILIVPAIAFTYVLQNWRRLLPLQWKNGLMLLVGYGIATLPRIVFEMKYSFMQSKVLLNFSERRIEINPTFQEIVINRLGLFRSYVEGMVQHDVWPLAWILCVCAGYGLFKGYSKLQKHEQSFVKFLSLLTTILFVLSLLYTKNPFYGYYYEALTTIFLLLVVFGLHALSKVSERMTLFITVLSMIVVLVHGSFLSYQQIIQKPSPEGLHMHTVAVAHILDAVQGQKFCLRMYTPPVITYTYNYILDREVGRRGATYPYDRFIKKECWYLIESDAIQSRREDWILKNIPQDAKKTYEYVVSPNLIIQKWFYAGTTSQPE